MIQVQSIQPEHSLGSYLSNSWGLVQTGRLRVSLPVRISALRSVMENQTHICCDDDG